MSCLLCSCCRLESHVPEGGTALTSGSPSSSSLDSPEPLAFPVSGWKSLVSGRSQSAAFTQSHLIAYFVQTETPCGDGTNRNFKAIASTDQKSRRLFTSGYVQKIELHKLNNVVCYRARCMPEMKSRSDYKLRMCVRIGDSGNVAEISFADCSCPAGKGPQASCKHLAALMYALEHFTRCGYIDSPTCTDVLQTWNQPSNKKSEPMTVKEMDGLRPAPKSDQAKRKRKHTAAELQDPRSSSKRGLVRDSVSELAYQSFHGSAPLFGLSLVCGSTAMTDIDRERRWQRQRDQQAPWLDLRNDVAVYAEESDLPDDLSTTCDCDVFLDGNCDTTVTDDDATPLPSDCEWMDADTTDDTTPVPSDTEWMDDNHKQWHWYQDNVVVTPEQAHELHVRTSDQHGSDLWMRQRKLRITASIAKTVARRRSSTDPARLVSAITDRPFFSSAATDWGIANEDVAREAYVEERGKSGDVVHVSKCGLIVNPEEPWFGASPDGIADDGKTQVVLEIKCPYSARNMSFDEAVRSVKNFCLQYDGSHYTLKRKHAYYYQVQMQLFVTGLSSCDFIVWSRTGGTKIDRIARDEFIRCNLATLRAFYFQHVLPKAAMS